MFNRADGLHVNAGQFRETFLCQTSVESGLADVPSKHSEDFAVVHCLPVSDTAPGIDTE